MYSCSNYLALHSQTSWFFLYLRSPRSGYPFLTGSASMDVQMVIELEQVFLMSDLYEVNRYHCWANKLCNSGQRRPLQIASFSAH